MPLPLQFQGKDHSIPALHHTMDNNKSIILFFFFFFFFITTSILFPSYGQLLPISDANGVNAAATKTHIVYLEKRGDSEMLTSKDLEEWHKSFLPNATLDSGKPRLVHSYFKAISGFAAELTNDEAATMAELKGVVSVELSLPSKLHTTHTPKFLLLEDDGIEQDGIWPDSSWGEGIIIGVIDTGAFPTHISFNDSGMPPPPPRWKVTECAFSHFKCNNKIIAARDYGGRDADDNDGHGTHVASIAAGSFVPDAHVLDNAKGRASGMAPLAHLAIYKAGNGPANAAKAVDDAILDGVDIISLSLGLGAQELHANPFIVAAFSAVKEGVFFSACAGNDGPVRTMIENDAPWMTTVGSGTTDRRVKAIVKLEDGRELIGESGYQPITTFNTTMLPLVFPAKESSNSPWYCKPGSYDDVDVKGKIVMCLYRDTETSIEAGRAIARAGGAAMILLSSYEGTFSDPHVLPVSNLNNKDVVALAQYFREERALNHTPRAAITFGGTDFGKYPAPKVSYFSSRGPSRKNGGILKPDIFAPGQNILAAWPYTVGPNRSTRTNSGFNFLSGTSMSTPHVSGIAALIKKIHPFWSPAAIKSAMMTTAKWTGSGLNDILDEYDDTKANVTATGAGHINPKEACDPGLIYELEESDYVSYLCGLGYTDKQITKFTQTKPNCSGAIEAEQLNYPSISFTIGYDSMKTIKRTVTNVGGSASTYTLEVNGLEGVSVQISPLTIAFAGPEERASFNLTFSTKGHPPSQVDESEGRLVLTDRKHYVQSPILITFT